jgi:hypothetical protein
MAWPGIGLALQWATCLAILAWAVWFLATRLIFEFAPSKSPGCHGCPGCDPAAERQNETRRDGRLATGGTPAAKLKTR